MNASPSTTSPQWPTHWPDNSFKSPWTWVAVAVLLCVIGVTFAAELNQSNAPIPNVPPLYLVIGFAVQAFLEGILIALILAVLPALSKMSLAQLGFRVPDLRTLGIAVAGAFAMAVVANGLASLIELVAHSKHQQSVVEMFKGVHDPATIGVFAVFAIVFAPFAEETMFRVFFFNLGLRFGGFWAGAIVSGVLFGLVHGDLFAAVPLALGGVILCYVYYRTRNAWASMISHGLFNALTVAALLFAPNLAS